MGKIRFFHAADLHLDSPFVGLRHLPGEIFDRIQNSTFASFENLVKEAVIKQIDFMIISGDLFDEEDRSIRAQAKLIKQFNRLKEQNIQVFVIHGNHDYLGGYRLGLDIPENVHIFSTEVEEKEMVTRNGTKVKLVGFSYEKRHINERKIHLYPKRTEEEYTIGILHGSEGSVKSLHEPYAPFSVEELLEKNYHYWALGHIHERRILHKDPYIVYPGNIQGRHRKETGFKGCYEVELDAHQTKLEFIPAQDIEWNAVHVSLQGVQRFGEIFTRIQKAIDLDSELENTLIEVVLTDNESLSEEMISSIENGDLLEALQSDFEFNTTFKWIHSIRLLRNQQALMKNREPFIQDVLKTLKDMDDEEKKEILAELYEHPSVFRFIEPLSQEQNEQLVEEIQDLFISTDNH